MSKYGDYYKHALPLYMITKFINPMRFSFLSFALRPPCMRSQCKNGCLCAQKHTHPSSSHLYFVYCLFYIKGSAKCHNILSILKLKAQQHICCDFYNYRYPCIMQGVLQKQNVTLWNTLSFRRLQVAGWRLLCKWAWYLFWLLLA